MQFDLNEKSLLQTNEIFIKNQWEFKFDIIISNPCWTPFFMN